MSEIEFKKWDKIKRDNPLNVTITEKMDGTNSCVIIIDGEIKGAQSRKRIITIDDDNYGFARWVEDNNDELLGLGDGYHFGEWAGLGIQKNPHNLEKKELFLFNTFRWNDNNPNLPECCNVVPVLFSGLLEVDTVDKVMDCLLLGAKDKYTPEGIIIYSHAFRQYTKQTFKHSKGKWSQ